MTLRLREHDLDWREIDDEIVVLDGERAEYLAVQGSGTLIWRLLRRATTRAALIDALVARYRIDPAQAGTDLDVFLATLTERGLLAS